MENKTRTVKVWEVEFLSPPPAVRHCKKCGKKTEFLSSGQFRVNAQRKDLDIWLIYKCSKCRNTWNLPVFSRINPKSLEPELLNKFHNNDSTLALRYAMDYGLLQRSGASVGPYSYRITGDSLPSGPAELHIKSSSASLVKVSAILREKLGISRKELEDQICSGRIQSKTGEDLLRCRLTEDTVLNIL
ncbi:DUF1062 domain-containing protein [Anaerostipes sp.]|uniref:DUF1062 domain-containing protein n=1 Tax=Anaerostipes sp. TaxID=1872530 RepID=UPI0025BE3A0D|nr:DUF1062 domain-containing protein [Anaerostipes sp.]MBS7009508.1 DUF1062 domain-containing protein [Anaerostipes sp.]